MKDKIEVGEYVRTKSGTIYKEKGIELTTEEKPLYNHTKALEIKNSRTVKHSKNIIDLIEVRRLCEWRRSRIYH